MAYGNSYIIPYINKYANLEIALEHRYDIDHKVHGNKFIAQNMIHSKISKKNITMTIGAMHETNILMDNIYSGEDIEQFLIRNTRDRMLASSFRERIERNVRGKYIQAITKLQLEVACEIYDNNSIYARFVKYIDNRDQAGFNLQIGIRSTF